MTLLLSWSQKYKLIPLQHCETFHLIDIICYIVYCAAICIAIFFSRLTLIYFNQHYLRDFSTKMNSTSHLYYTFCMLDYKKVFLLIKLLFYLKMINRLNTLSSVGKRNHVSECVARSQLLISRLNLNISLWNPEPVRYHSFLVRKHKNPNSVS